MYAWNELVKIDRHFQTSVNLLLDRENEEKFTGYIPTESSVHILKQYLENVQKGNGQNAAILIGPYGKGKSHLLLVLLGLLEQSFPKAADKLIKKLADVDKECGKYADEVRKGRPYLTVLVSDTGSSLNEALLLALREALIRKKLDALVPDSYYTEAVRVIERWKENFPEIYGQLSALLAQEVRTAGQKEDGQEYRQEYRNADTLTAALRKCRRQALECFCSIYERITGGNQFQPLLQTDCLKTYQEVNSKLCLHYGYAGIYIVFDEFSKYIEGHAEEGFAYDMKVLQDICELANSSGSSVEKLFVTCVAHKSLKEYGNRLSTQVKNAFKGVEGRLKEYLFVVSVRNNFGLLRSVLQKTEKFQQMYGEGALKPYIEDIARRSYELPFFRSQFTWEEYEEIVVKGCFPLTPLAAAVLLYVSEKAAQNERTIFTFLAGEEAGSILHKITARRKSRRFFLGTDDVYDYFSPVFRENLDRPEIHNEWLKAEYALQHTEEETQAAVIKAAALLHIVGNREELPVTLENMALAAGLSAEECKGAVEELQNRQLLIWRSKLGVYAFKNNVGVNIEEELRREMEKQPGNINLCGHLAKISELEYVLPKSYNQTFSITRYFQYVFMTPETFLKIERTEYLFEEKFADGKIIALVREKNEEERMKSFGESRVKGGQEEESRIRKNQAEEGQTEGSRIKGGQEEESRIRENQAEEGQTEGSRIKGSQEEESRIRENQAEGGQTEGSRINGSQAEERRIRESQPVEDRIKRKLAELQDSRLVVILPEHPFTQEQNIRKLLAVEQLLESEEFLEENKVLKQELQLYREDILFEINAELEKDYLPENGACLVLHDGEECFFDKGMSFNRFLSSVCEEYYSFAPRINHELLNIRNVTGQYLKARNAVTEHILRGESWEKYEKGTSPEALIFRTALVRTGVTGGKYPLDTGTGRILEEIRSFLQSSGEEKRCFSELYTKLQGKDYGVRRGVLPLFLAAELTAAVDVPVLYLQNKEVACSVEILNNINERPQQYYLFLEKESRQKEEYLCFLEKLLDIPHAGCRKNVRISQAAEALQREYRSLPKLVSNWKEYEEKEWLAVPGTDSEEAKLLYEAAEKLKVNLRKIELNPRELLFEKLPSYFGQKEADILCGRRLESILKVWKHRKSFFQDKLAEYILGQWQAQKEESLAGVLKEWHEKVRDGAYRKVLSAKTEALLRCIASIDGYDNGKIAEGLGKAVTGIYLEDWTVDTWKDMESQLPALKAEAEQAADVTQDEKNRRKIMFTNSQGEMIEKYFPEESGEMTIFFKNALQGVLEEFGESMDNGQKASGLFEVMKELLGQ